MLMAVLMLAAFSLYGCPRSDEGMKEDTTSKTQMPADEGTDTGEVKDMGETEPGAGNMEDVSLPTDVEALVDIYFDFDKSSIRQSEVSKIEDNANWIKANADQYIVIEGHCDERGTVAYNLALGERRANSARDYLVALGIERSRMKTVSYGEERPADPGHNEAAWAKNRRAHFVAGSARP